MLEITKPLSDSEAEKGSQPKALRGWYPGYFHGAATERPRQSDSMQTFACPICERLRVNPYSGADVAFLAAEGGELSSCTLCGDGAYFAN